MMGSQLTPLPFQMLSLLRPMLPLQSRLILQGLIQFYWRQYTNYSVHSCISQTKFLRIVV